MISNSVPSHFESLSSDELVIHNYTRGRKGLFNYIDAFEKSSDRPSVLLIVPDVEEIFRKFCSIFKVIEAAGGLVLNDNHHVLAIFRRGSWDLPKGKIEKKESVEEAAIREVQEETGVQNLKIVRSIGTTYHTYRTKKDKRALKVSHWFEMYSTDIDLDPQQEEDIERAEWVDYEQFGLEYRPMYGNIRDVLEMYNEKRLT